MKITLRELRRTIRSILVESSVKVKKPISSQEKESFLQLTKWASSKMQVPEHMLDSALEKASSFDDWDEAMSLMNDYYVLKGIKFRAPS